MVRGHLEKEKIDIAAIQETKLTPNVDDPRIPRYTVVRRDRPPKGGKSNRGGGLMFVIKTSIGYKPLKLDIRLSEDKDFSESLCIEIPTKGDQKLRITNLYIPPVYCRGERRTEWFNTEKWPKGNSDLVLGDINAHSVLWDDHISEGKSDRRGILVERWLSTNEMHCLNEGQPTFKSRSRDTQSTPDVTFIHTSQIEKQHGKLGVVLRQTTNQ